MKDDLASAKARLSEIEAREFVEANKGRFSDEDAFIQLYKKHGKDVASAFLGTIL